jgi:hypothetical protein
VKSEDATPHFSNGGLSELSQGKVTARLDLPTRNRPKQTLLRLRVPDGWKLTSAKADGKELRFDKQATMDISSLKGSATIEVQVKR